MRIYGVPSRIEFQNARRGKFFQNPKKPHNFSNRIWSDLLGFGRIRLAAPKFNVGGSDGCCPARTTQHQVGARPEGPQYLRNFVVKTRSGWPDRLRFWLKIGFVFLDTYALSLAFLRKNWVRFVISTPITFDQP
jgi:hypothetical protein